MATSPFRILKVLKVVASRPTNIRPMHGAQAFTRTLQLALELPDLTPNMIVHPAYIDDWQR